MAAVVATEAEMAAEVVTVEMAMADKSRVNSLTLIVSLLAAALCAQAQTPPRVAPVPAHPLELATAALTPAGTQPQRDAALELLSKARNRYALRNVRQPWDLKVRFTVDSQGRTNYDGEWQMEDVFSPGQGLHWSARSSAGYAVSGIFAADETFMDATSNLVPLRLQEARALLYNPIPSTTYAGNGSIRTLTTTFQNSPLTCVLLSQVRDTKPAAGRAWNETEDCIDPGAGLLRIHSDAPGRYAVYDYTNGPRLGTHAIPRTVTVWEGGRVVCTVSVESLQALAAADPALFTPTDAMKAAGPAVSMTSATRISRVHAPTPLPAGTTLRPLCVFGLLTPSGRLVEAHSLQPADPNSDAAVKDAESIDFSPALGASAVPQQRFVFVIESFPVELQ